MRGRPKNGFSIHYVHAIDAGAPRERPARILGRTQAGDAWFYPVTERGPALLGYDLTGPEDERAGPWVALETPLRWEPGKVPVVRSRDPIRIELVRPATVDRDRKKAVCDEVLRAFDPGDPWERAGALELVDGLLEDRPLGSAAMLALASELGGAIGSLDVIRQKVRSGFRHPGSIGLLLSEPELEPLRARGEVSDRILGAVLRCGEPILDSSWRRVETLVREALDSESSPTDAPVQARRSWQLWSPALRYFSDELGLLVRRTASSSVLERWSFAHPALRNVGHDARRTNFTQPWQAAKWAAAAVREILSLRGCPELPLGRLLENIGGFVARVDGPPTNAVSAWSDGVSGPWVTFLGPGAGRAGVGFRRFATAHQLGHVVAGDEPASCVAILEDESSPQASAEKFANAFAAYLLAPSDAVQALVGEAPCDTPSAIQESARSVAVAFGLSPMAALYHVMNCAHETDVERRVAELHENGTVNDGWLAAVGDAVDDVWEEDDRRLDEEVGVEPVGNDIRPHSARRDRLFEEAVQRGSLSQAELEALT